MDCRIIGRNVQLDDKTKAYLTKRMSKLDRIYSRIYDCEVVLDEEKGHKKVEVVVKLKRNRIVASESSPDIFSAIDDAVDSVVKQLRRMSDKVKTTQRRKIIKNVMKSVRGWREEETSEL